MIRKISLVLIGLSVLGIVFGLVIFWRNREDPRVRSRRELVTFKLVGVLPDEGWGNVIRRMMPSSDRDNWPVLRLDAARWAKPETGEQLFKQRCAICHGGRGEGGTVGVDLTRDDVQVRLSDLNIYTALTRGIPGTNMPPSNVSITDGLRLTAYVRSIHSKAGGKQELAAGRGSNCLPCKNIHVSSTDVVSSSTHPEGWLSYSGDYSGKRFAALSQINKTNLSRLRPRFIYQTKSLVGIEATPLVSKGVMFLTGPENEVIALDLATGDPFWIFRRVVPASVLLCCGRQNRGVALLGNRVFYGTLDAHLVALSVETGRPIWDVEVADSSSGYSMTGAPLAVDGKIIVGVGGGDFGIRGFIAAYDAETGKRLWRFETIPPPGQPGHETWQNDGWKTGGGATWMVGTYDPDLHLLYWGIGNPAPEFNPQSRPGDNLYTCAVVALDPNTGSLRWYYQFTPGDGDDWDANEVPVLADAKYDGQLRKLMYFGNRNCFFYVLDRETGKFLRAGQYCGQNWNDGFTAEGRPIRRRGTLPSDSGPVSRPAVEGGSNWPPPAYSPLTGLFYVKYRESQNRVFAETPHYVAGIPFLGGSVSGKARSVLHLAAIRALTATVAWDKTVERGGHDFYDKSGVLATSSGIVITGDSEGRLVIFDAESGKDLWSYSLGAQMAMAPITYLYNGSQEMAIISAGSVMVFSLVN